MIDFASFYEVIARSPLGHWLETLPAQLSAWENAQRHGDLPRWQRVLKKLEPYQAQWINLKDQVQIGQPSEISTGEQTKLTNLLQHFHPWRKGPFDVFGIHIDTEWRSDWKWDRLLPHISPLKDRYVLDVGCGSGYHLWRMLGEEARLAVGIDPSPLFLCQFNAIKQLAGSPRAIHLLPLGIEELPALQRFDTVFSMGVLYHRRSPIDHLFQLQDQLRPGGELILETLIVDGDEDTVFMPDDRYAQMNNVWFLPSIPALHKWLKKCGFTNIRMVSCSATTPDEQRQTEWMRNDSLSQYLMPDDPNKTIEGYPAPLRAIFIATKETED